MKPHVLIGLVLAVILGGAIYMTPSFLRDPAKVAARDAEQEAALALRQLHRYDPVLPQVRPLADPAELKQANVEALTEQARPALDALGEEINKNIQAMREQDRRLGAPREQDLKITLPTTPGGLQKAINDYEQLVKANDALLAEAVKNAGSATRTSATAIGVAQTDGMVQMQKSAVALTTAEAFRRDLEILDDRLLALAAEWKITQSFADHYKGIDVSGALEELRKDQEELKTGHDQAAAEGETLTKEIAAREGELATVESALKAAQADLLNLEKNGFQAGSDASYNAYRDQYQGISKNLQALQLQQEELSAGGLKGAKLAEEDESEKAPLEGGQPVIGLPVLKARLIAAQEKQKRLASAQKTLQEHIEYVEALEKSAKAEAGRYTQRLDELKGRMQETLKEIDRTAGEAFAKEKDALDAATAAAKAFGSSETAVQQLVRDARTAQQEADPQRKNERLTLILNDAALQQVPTSAKAAAQTLAGAVYAQRIEALSMHVAVLQRFAEVFPGSTIDVKAIQTAIETAREGGDRVLSDAVKSYDQVAKALSSKPTVWIPKASQANAAYLLSKVQAANREKNFGDALRLIQEAVDKREQSPYLATLVRFRDHLKGLSTEESKPDGGTEGQ